MPAEIAITLDREVKNLVSVHSAYYFSDHKLENNAKLSFFIDDVVDQNIPISLEDCPLVDAEIIAKMRDCEAIF